MNAGAEAEQLAAQYLQRHGLTLIERNYRCRAGEIDLIMKDGSTLVFVEVRQRSREDFGGAAASIDGRKQYRLVLTAEHYLASLAGTPPCRFDALLVNGKGEIDWLKNAFQV